MVALESRAGPEGENAKNDLHLWNLLLAGRALMLDLLTSGLPAGADLVASIMRDESRRALAHTKGSQGGDKVGSSMEDGFCFFTKLCNREYGVRGRKGRGSSYRSSVCLS